MIDKQERKYLQLRKLGQELHIPIPEHFLELEVFKDGKRIQHLKQRSHSWVRNTYNMLLSQIACKNLDSGAGEYGPGFLSIKDTAGVVWRGAGGSSNTVVNSNFEGAGNAYRAAAAITTRGILVGSGINAESFEDWALQTLITEGIGAGQLNYAATEVPTKSYAALTQTITWFRYINNNSAGNVSVNEVALCAHGYVPVDLQKYFLISRDKLGATIVIPPTGQLKVTYSIQLVYPS